MVDSDVTNYIQLFYNLNNNLNKFSGVNSNALYFPALLSSSENCLKEINLNVCEKYKTEREARDEQIFYTLFILRMGKR